MIKFEEHDGKLFRILDKPVPLTPDAKFPCVVRLIQDDSPMGRYNQSYSEYRYGVRCCMLPIIATHIAKNGVVNDIEWDINRYEIIGTFVKEGSDEWALWRMMQGEYVIHEGLTPCNIHCGMVTWLDSQDSQHYTMQSPDKWLLYCPFKDGWQLYEPKPKPLLADAKIGWRVLFSNNESRTIKDIVTHKNLPKRYVMNEAIVQQLVGGSSAATAAFNEDGTAYTHFCGATPEFDIHATYAYDPKATDPKPEPIFTTGDKVTDGVIEGTIIHIEDAIADVCPSTDEYKIELRNLNHIPESPKQDDVEKPLRSMIAEAKAIGKNIRTYYQDIVFTPQALEACLNQGEFRWWNICNWELTTREQNYYPSISTSSDEPKNDPPKEPDYVICKRCGGSQSIPNPDVSNTAYATCPKCGGTGYEIKEQKPDKPNLPKEQKIDSGEKEYTCLVCRKKMSELDGMAEVSIKRISISSLYESTLSHYCGKCFLELGFDKTEKELRNRQQPQVESEPQTAKEPIANCENCKHVCTNSNIDHCHMYEPKPKSENIIHGYIPADMHLKYFHLCKFKVGDWVEWCGGQYMVESAPPQSGGRYDIRSPYDELGCSVYPENITRKLSPDEIVVDFGSFKGTIKRWDSTTFHIFHGNGKFSKIHIDALDTPTRKLVESLLKAQEEYKQ